MSTGNKNQGKYYGLQIRLVRQVLTAARNGVITVPAPSRVWYIVRPQLEEAGVILSRNSRRTIQFKYVLQVCREWGIKRADIGIHVSERVQAYYRGKEYDINPDNIDELAKQGVAMIAMEKEGLAAQMAPFAVDQEIVILDTKGFNTENGEDFCDIVQGELSGENIAMVHDFDASGVKICKDAGLVSIGVDLEFLKELGIKTKNIPPPGYSGLTIKDVEERYDGSSNTHWKWLRDNYPDYEYLDYIATKRIEIDGIMYKLEKRYGVEKAKQMFWKAVSARFVEKFPTRDYTKVIDIKALLTTPSANKLDFDYSSNVVDKLNEHIDDINDSRAEDKREEIKEALENYEGLPEIKALKEEKRKEFSDAMEEQDPETVDIHSVCLPILEQLTEQIEDQVSSSPQDKEISDMEERMDQLQAEIDERQKELDDLESEKSDKEDELVDEIITPLVEQAETEVIIPAIKELDEEKGYNIVEDAGLEAAEEEDEEDEE
jgi:hypothetical protein